MNFINLMPIFPRFEYGRDVILWEIRIAKKYNEFHGNVHSSVVLCISIKSTFGTNKFMNKHKFYDQPKMLNNYFFFFVQKIPKTLNWSKGFFCVIPFCSQTSILFQNSFPSTLKKLNKIGKT